MRLPTQPHHNLPAGVPTAATGVPAVSGFAMLKILMECIGRVLLLVGEYKIRPYDYPESVLEEDFAEPGRLVAVGGDGRREKIGG